MRIKSFLKYIDHSTTIYVGILFAVFLTIVATNFPFTSWYTGWDNLHPEFNFGMNFQRALGAVWQTNQGLGTYGGHGYAATLLHTVFLWLLSIVVPIKFLRSVFTFFTLIVGALGVFFLLKKMLGKFVSTSANSVDSNKDLSTHSNIINASSLAAAVYYMLNLATVQNFYIQLEAFIVHFAALPWLFYVLFMYLGKRSKKNLLIFALVNLVASVQGFIPPLFFVYVMLLGIFLFFYVISPSRHSGEHSESRIKSDSNLKGFRSWMRFAYQDDDGINSDSFLDKLKTAIILILIVLAMNAYWFLPVVNYSMTRSGTYLSAYNNLSSTDDFIWKNKKFGNIQNVTLLRGFIFEAIDADNSGNVFLIFQPWQQHLNNPIVSVIGYSIFGVILSGAIFAIWKKRNWYMLGLVAGLLFVFSLMATDSFPFSIITQIMQHIPVIKQAFRVAFTKFSIALSLYYALCFGIGVYAFLEFLKNKKWTQPVIIFLALTLLFTFSLPIFQGNFLYKRTKIQIPSMYFQMFDFFKHQDKQTRIANFPQGWNWGWSIYKWGYSGSGFLWYGIEQPIMDRAFDVWGKYNEQYYWELSHAIFAERYDLIDTIVEKYQVNWIVFDDNEIPYASVKSFLYSDKLKKYFQSSKKYSLVKVFNSENNMQSPIWIYKVNLSKRTINFSSLYQPTQIKAGIAPYRWVNTDPAFLEYGVNYSLANNDSITYPFRELFTNREPGQLPFQIRETAQDIAYRGWVPKNSQKFSIVIPPLTNDEVYSGINPNSLELEKLPKIFINNQLVYPLSLSQITTTQTVLVEHSQTSAIELRLPKAGFPLSYTNISDPDFYNHKAVNCNILLQQINKEPGIFEQSIVDQNTLHFRSLDTENCYDIWTGLSQRYAYIVSFDSRFITGQPLRFAVIDHQSRKPSAINLPRNTDFATTTYIIPPMKSDGVGYNLHFNTISIGTTPSENELKNIQVRPIPYTFLSNLRIESNSMPIAQKSVIAYYQSFDPGWKAYEINSKFQNSKFKYFVNFFPFVFGTEIKDHVLVNNWANGWTVDPNNTATQVVVFTFIPQCVEYLGFFIVIVTIGVIILYKKEDRPI